MGPLDFDQKICARCGRVCSPKDFEPARAANRAAARRRLARKAFNWILFAACAAGAYARRETILGLASRARGAVEREMDAASRPAHPGKQLSSQAPRPAVRPPEPQAPAGSEVKRVYGVVYNMSTAAPVAWASLVFSKNGRSWRAGADSDGHYTVDIPAGDFKEGLTAVVRAEGYREGQVEDVDPPYRERSAEERQSAIEILSPSDLDPLPVRAPPNGTVVPFDIVLIPLAPR
jgi:hypothetical protein